MPEIRFLAGSRGRISGHDVTKLLLLIVTDTTCYDMMVDVQVDPYRSKLVSSCFHTS